MLAPLTAPICVVFACSIFGMMIDEAAGNASAAGKGLSSNGTGIGAPEVSTSTGMVRRSFSSAAADAASTVSTTARQSFIAISR